MSELVREALRSYSLQESEKRWDALAKLGAAAAKRAGIESEEDVVRLIHEFRQEKRA